ncbi:hypothetical protein Pla163_10730 [Planctomycetes bacterium Pla163]|uniref:BNR/Asp-box repeat protein n=1 Tax=Rohdeia mirabilis TaxID=2528008 RepID=A0A518CXL8_9BACT|nr:hypothetical protein Pla163_10730 [Planctomycetes bacterium Pla163]
MPATINTVGDGDIHLASSHGDAVQYWSTLPGGPHNTTALTVSPTFTSDQTVMATSQKNLVGFSSLWKSTDAGLSWAEMPQPAQVNFGKYFKDLALSPNFATDQIIVCADGGFGNRTFQSSDGGANWQLIQPLAWGFQDITFAHDFATSGFVYGFKSAGSPRFFRSDDFGVKFLECSHPLSNPGLCPITDRTFGIAVAPVDPQGQRAIYYYGKGDPIFAPENFVRSFDNGDNWEFAGAGLEGLWVFDVVVADDGSGSGRLYAATNQGVYTSDDRGRTFSYFDTARLPNPVTKLELVGGLGGDLYAIAGGDPDPEQFAGVAPGADQPGNLYRLRLSGTGSYSLGLALAGVNGKPSLKTSTSFGATSAFRLELTKAAPSAPVVHVLGGTAALVPILGGILVPSADLFMFGATDAAGSDQLNLGWPANFAPGSEVFAQSWTIDAAAMEGLSASNGLKLTRL